MIIGINGKIGSGKDTIGDIIQYLTTDKKDISYGGTYVSYCIDKGCGSNITSPFEIKKFAGKLKQIASLLTGIPIEKFEDQEFKKSLLGDEWGTVKENPLNSIPVFEDVQFNHLMSVRELLQKLGTEAMRDGLHTNVWVNALFADYKEIKPPKGNTFDYLHTECIDCKKRFNGYKRQFICNDCHDTHNWYSNWIITDMRFPNEMEAVVEKGGITIRVVRNNNTKYSDEKVKAILKDMGYVDLSDGVWEELAIDEGFTWFETFKLWTWDETDNNNESLHPSETALDDAKFDYVIENDGTIEDLIEKVKEILIKENII